MTANCAKRWRVRGLGSCTASPEALTWSLVKVSKYDLPAVLDPKRIRAAREGLPSPEVVSEAVEVFKALANPIRVRILHALAHDELSVGDLAHAFELPLSTVSHKLALLRRLRLVSSLCAAVRMSW